MRYPWRVLLFRSQNLSALHVSKHFSQSQVHLNPNLQSLSSLTSLLHHRSINDTLSSPFSGFIDFVNPLNLITRDYVSEPVLEQSEPDHAFIVDLFSKQMDFDDIKKEVVLNDILVNHDTVLKVLGHLNSSCKEEFWDLVEDMKKKGYGVSRGVRDKDPRIIQLRMLKIVRHNVWGDDVEKQILDLNVVFSSENVKLVLENFGTEPGKALIFFRWLEESGQFKHDESTYNAMARVLGREDTIDRFWKVADEMRSKGYEMEVETFVKVLGRFCKRRIMKDAVDLYEFAMAGSNKPSPQCCTFLLRKIVADKKLDMSLFSRVVKALTGSGNALTNPMVESILKSLSSVGRTGDCNKVLKALDEDGFVASGNLQSKIAFRLGPGGNKEEASEFMDNIGASGSYPDRKTWATDASKFLCQLVHENQLKPRHSTYKLLITKLLVRGGFTHAVKILGIMRSHGFPPFADPFVEHVSKSGTGDDAILFLKEMTSKKFPSESVFLLLNLFCSMKSTEGASSGKLDA
ncbi:hypothetical protein L6164_006581 [Bauhinia variegata]|uniref:Uncharacterized protein n=1 Tax=Bauhinia variegata TaxID=167791 RepID=A0ACB9PUB2_BAUVA|nr:hypothetical protein L6164_006581 [Bauhinia variegata]